MIRAFLLALLLHLIFLTLLLQFGGSRPFLKIEKPPELPVRATVVPQEEVERAYREWEAAELAEKERRAKELQAWQERLQALQKGYQKRLQQLRRQEESLKADLAKLRQRQVEMEEALRSKRETLENDYRKRLAELEAQEAEYRGHLQSLQAELEAARNRLKEERSKIEQQLLEERLRLAVDRIRRKVEGRWQRPLGYEGRREALLEVTLGERGEVRGVKVVQGSGDPLFDRSAVAAVYRASPLPLPEEAALRERLRRFKLRFRPEGES